MKLKKLVAATALAAGSFGLLGSAQATPVALELSLVVDVSGSISAADYNTQVQGYKNAFLDATLQSNILSYAAQGGIAVNVIQFGTNAAQAIGWTQLTTAAQITSFANAIGAMGRLGAVGTSTDVEDGMLAGINAILTNAYEGQRRVIDVSGDGYQNVDPACSSAPASACAAVQSARNLATTNGITVNGLAIEGDMGPGGVTTWYNTNVRTADGFVTTAAGFADFEAAALTKIGKEITDVPEPDTLALAGLGLLGLGLARRRRAR